MNVRKVKSIIRERLKVKGEEKKRLLNLIKSYKVNGDLDKKYRYVQWIWKKDKVEAVILELADIYQKIKQKNR